MQVKILGGHGGVTKNCRASSYLIDDKLLIDAGAVAGTLNLDEQLQVQNILISHAHLDHIKDLAFLCDNCFGLKKEPFNVYSHQEVKNAILKHIFNDVIWPDFSVLPTKERSIINFHEIASGEEFSLGDYRIQAVSVAHPGHALGFIIEKNDCSLLFTMDTASTDKIWELAKQRKNLKAIFSEISFPERLAHIAQISDHHTPQTFLAEMKKMPIQVPIYVGHLKPAFEQELIDEIRNLKSERLHILGVDGDLFSF